MASIHRIVVALVLAFLLLPVAFVIVSSVGAGAITSFPPKSFTLSWYENIPEPFFESLRISLFLAFMTATTAAVLGLGLALALARGKFLGRNALATFALSPLMTPSLVIAVALYQFTGFVWDWTGLDLQDTLLGILIGHVACATPYSVRAILASHSQFDHSLEEAALSLGAGRLKTLVGVTIPVLMPGMFAGALFGFLISLDDLPIAFFMGGDESNATLPVRIYSAVEYSFTPNIMSVSAIIIFVSLAAMIALDRVVGVEKLLGEGRT